MPKRERHACVSNRDYWTEFFDSAKRDRYKDTLFLSSEAHAASVLEVLQDGSPCPARLVTYRVRKVPGHEEGCNRDTSGARPLAGDHVMEWCSSSLSRIIDLMLRLR